MQSSKITLKAVKGVVTDISNDDLPEGFAISSLNGRFLPARDGKSFTWVSVKGEKPIRISGEHWQSGYVISQMQEFDNSIIAFVYNIFGVDTYIFRLFPVYDTDQVISGFTATKLVYDEKNAYLQISTTPLSDGTLPPIVKIRVVRETDLVYTIYWLDQNETLKSVRIVTGEDNISLVNSSFSQQVIFGSIEFKGLVAGSLPGGAMFYAYRYLGLNGSISDWSMEMGPVMIHNRLATSSTWAKFHTIKYAKKDEKSECGVELLLDGIDPSFDKIQVVACVSADNKTFEKGYIFHEEKINSRTSITIQHTSDKSYGTVLSEDIQISTQTVVGCVDFEIVNNIMVVIGPKTDNTLDTTIATDKIQFNKVIDGEVIVNTVQIPFDTNIYTTNQPAYTTDPIGMALTVASNHTTSKYKNQTSLSNETKLITAGTGFVGYKNPVYETLMRNCWRGETYRIGMVPVTTYGKRLGVRWISDITIPERGDSTNLSNIELIDEVTTKYYANVVNILIGGIDVTQWIHGDPGSESWDIQGFHIVVAPREKRRLNEGVLMCAAEHDGIDGVMEDYGVIRGNRFDNTPSTDSDKKSRPIPGLYQYYSPDVQNDLLLKAEPGSKMRIEDQLYGLFTDYMPNAETTDNGTKTTTYPLMGASDSFYAYRYGQSVASTGKGIRIWNKYYNKLTSLLSQSWVFARNPASHEECDIDGYYDLPAFNGTADHDAQAIYVRERASRKFINAYWGKMDLTDEGTKNSFGGGAENRLLVLNDTLLTGYSAANPYATAFTNGITIVSSMANSSPINSDPDDNELASTIYRSCWHYQPINQTVLNHIRTIDGRYVFDDIEVFPGDSFIVPYSVNRLFHTINYETTEHPTAPTTDLYPSISFVVPLQSNINWLMHDGDGWLEHRSFRWYNGTFLGGSSDYGTGIGVMKYDDFSAYGMLEKFLYPQFANVIYGQNLYFALSESVFFTNNYPMRFFWSKRKTDAEEIDSFRQFPFENYQSIQGSYGLPVAVCALAESVIIFTEDGIGQVPIDERSSITDASGKSLLIGQTPGVGRFVIIDRKHGLSLTHRNSLSQYGEDFTWFDFKNKEWVFFGKGQGVVDLSLKFKFQSDLSVMFKDIATVDRTTIRTAFLTEKEIMIYDPTKGRSFVFDYLNGLYQGRRDIVVRESLMFGSIPILLTATKVTIPGFGLQNQTYNRIVDTESGVVGSGNPALESYDPSWLQTELTMVANVNPLVPKIWDSFRLQGVNIEKIVLNNDQLNPESSTVTVLGLDHFMNTYSIVENLDDLYVGEITLTQQYDFLRGYYLTVRICGLKSLNQVKLNYLSLNYRNDVL